MAYLISAKVTTGVRPVIGALTNCNFGQRRDQACTEYVCQQVGLKVDEVCVEGGDWPVADSREAAITRYAEMGWTRLLAARAGVEASSFEPRMGDEIATVLQEFTAEDVKLYYTLRWVPQFNITDPDDLDALIERELRRLGRYQGLNVPPHTLEQLASIAQRRLNIRDWHSLGYEWTDPVTHRRPNAMSFLNEVAAASARVRDASLQQQARAAVARGERVLIIAGRAHWIESTPRLDLERSH
jgi:hypothetical protein